MHLSAWLGVLGHYDDHTRVSAVKPVQEVHNTVCIENLATTMPWKNRSSFHLKRFICLKFWKNRS
jgi:hypothetical protein